MVGDGFWHSEAREQEGHRRQISWLWIELEDSHLMTTASALRVSGGQTGFHCCAERCLIALIFLFFVL